MSVSKGVKEKMLVRKAKPSCFGLYGIYTVCKRECLNRWSCMVYQRRSEKEISSHKEKME